MSAGPRTAFVLAGGGSLGAVEVGMLRALVDANVHADWVVGSSAGAINAAFFAGKPTHEGVDELAAVWAGLRGRDVFPFSPVGGLLGVLALRDHMVEPGPLARLIAQHLPYERLEQAKIPIQVVATDVLSGKLVALSQGPARPALLASAAIPGVFPPVKIDGVPLFDGGIASNTPVAAALALGAERVIVLPTGYTCEMKKPPSSALAMALHGLNLMIARQLVIDVERFQDRTPIRVVPPLCPQAVQAFDFSAARALIERAERSTQEWLRGGGLERGGIPHELPAHTHEVI
jgi:NTE family protein